MAIEAYIPSEVRFDARPVAGAMVVTLYDADADAAHGSLTTPQAPVANARGRLEFVGRRDGKEWRVLLDVAVRNRTACGCEFAISGPVRREVLRDLGEQAGPHQKGLEERFDIR